ncbi:MAG: ABC transporter permease subunit [Clostridia bacterium]|nr:ABC transporter permease subunit [Clostridia bacterium]
MQASKKLLKNTAVFLFWLGVWHIAASLANRGLILDIPTPLTTLTALIRLLPQKAFILSVLGSVGRIVLGYLIAAAAGIICAVAAFRFPLFKTLTAPILQMIRAVPVAAFIILVYLWLKEGAIPVFISFLMVFPLVWANTEAGLSAIDKKLIEMAKVMELSRKNILRHIILPAVLPPVFAAFTTGLGFAWKSGVAAEVICRTGDSVGNLLWASKTSVEYDEVFAITAVIVVLSVLLENVLKITLGRYGSDKAK